MAIITCPNCKKMVSDSGSKCPNCRATLRSKLSDTSTPFLKKLQTFNTIFLYVSAALVLVELFEVFRTYVGGILLGIGCFIHAYIYYRKGKEEGTNERKKIIFIAIMGAVILLTGILTLYLDLTR